MGQLGVLYISYDGMLEPLGQSQVIAYLERLATTRKIHLISFEKPTDLLNFASLDAVSRRLDSAGIQWHRLRYHKSPSAVATAYDILVGTILGLLLTFWFGLRIVHARSYVASVIALFLKTCTNVRFVFDMRGFWADERVDGGIWRSDSHLYRTAKWFEKRFLLTADHVVSLTHAGAEEIQRFGYLSDSTPTVSVIPTCADLERFRPQCLGRPAAASSQDFTLGYVGSAGTWYMFDTFVESFQQLRLIRPNSCALILNRGEHDLIRRAIQRAGIPLDAVELRAADHAEVPSQMARMNAAAFFIRPVFSKKASAPTKLAEFLGCGIPCLTNTGVGDMSKLLRDAQVGVAVSSFDDISIRAGVEELLALCEDPGLRVRCREAAVLHFGLSEGVSAYNRIYDLLDQAQRPAH